MLSLFQLCTILAATVTATHGQVQGMSETNLQNSQQFPMSVDYSDPDYWNVPPSDEMQSDPQHTKSSAKTKSQFTYGSCSTRLQAPMNSALKCTSVKGCVATCMRGYTFPDGANVLSFVCDNSLWKVKGSSDNIIPHCKPTCIPTCHNGGTCTAPNTCACPDNFSGAYCQFEKKHCNGYPPTPNNSYKKCNSEVCTIQCLKNHEFPDKSGVANVFCRDGEWTTGRPDWTTIPDCSPVCIPVCQNGGKCLSLNQCNCPQQFRGPQCQYSVDVCDSRKLNFNGNYNCSEREDLYMCSLRCPAGMDFSSQPAISYSCDYSEGRFHPSSVPQCVFEGREEHNHLEMIFSGKNNNFMSENEIASKFPIHRKIKTAELSSRYNELFKNLIVLEKKTPTSGRCFTWAGYHYKTFDGRVISFKGGCSYVLVSDIVDNTFQIQTSSENCTADFCRLGITIYVGEKKYQLTINENMLPMVVSGTKVWPVPNQLADLRTEIAGYALVVTLQTLGVSLRWNLMDTLEVKVTEAQWNRTGGLCGRMDGHATNDLSEEQDSVLTYANKWQANPPLDKCTSPVEEDACLDSASQQAAHQFCNRLMTDNRYDACRQLLSARQYYEACRWDYCTCEDQANACGCRSLAMFVRDCLQKGEKSVENWRDEENCPVECSGGRVYKACGPATIATCRVGDAELLSEQCEEGCYCPEGTRLHENQCIPQDQCPCYRQSKPFQSGQKVAKGCNTCECVKGQWSCTEVQCEAWCGAIGDPHYQTFDGRKFNFMGKCSYYLIKTDNYTIESENIPCDGKISESMGLSVVSSYSTPSCTKAVVIRLGDNQVLKLKQHQEITINNEDVESLPVMLAGAYVRVVSSMFIMVEMPDGAEVWWDGQTRVYVNAPATLKGQTKGLCGTFNGNQKDDFLTPEGDVEQDAVAFANKWKTRESCDNTDSGDIKSHPCDKYIQNRAVAESHCSNITSNLFADCHHLVDPTTFYEDCLFDVCSCHSQSTECMCPLIAAYAKECSHEGAVVDWRDKVIICGVQCPSGQQYQACSSSCAHSCNSLSRPCARHLECVEGCYCPPGLTIGPNGDCIAISSCPCLHNGMEYPPTHKEIRPASKGLQFCECRNAVWQCSHATSEQIRDYPNQSLDFKTSCSATRHQEFTHCEPPEPVTCKNMHNPPKVTPSICHAGCVCRRGYVLDSLTKECVKATECPCHHGSHSYPDGHTIQEECNTCTCEAGKWRCTEKVCPGVCSAWGDPHFRTFDDRIFDFEGACDYMLAKGSLSESDSFNVAIETVPCGSSGVTCSRAVTLSVGSGDRHESITFSANRALSHEGLERITVREAGLFSFAEVADLGILLQWDKGTRVIVKVDPKWKGRLKGLCGNFNGDESDDFQTPSGGISEVSAELFGDSWKLQPYCPPAKAVTDTCKLHPTRKSWAVKKCSILKSAVFKPCHSEVPIDSYLQRCVFDVCGCDQGGDSLCLCTALAAYTQQCNIHGVHIKWRTQQLCPIQCDETCSEYKPCVKTCPLETCDNTLVYKSLTTLCSQDTCVEGCEMKPCPAGQVYHNMTDLNCVPVAECKPVCLTINGKDFYEGDYIEGDGCYSCYCSRHKKTCTGLPCTTSTPSTTTTTNTNTPEADQPMECRPGWSDWMNNDQPIPDKKDSDIEPLPSPKDFKDVIGVKKTKTKVKGAGQCSRDMMVDIDCRVAHTHEHYKDKMQDVECSLENGLVCRGLCDDYEIRVLCDCGTTSATTPSTTTTTTTTTSTTVSQTTSVLTEQPTIRQTTTTTSRPTSTTIGTTEEMRCDVLSPLKPHPEDCSRYFQCVETTQGLESLERECSLPLWFNTKTMNCDWPDNVKQIRPECSGEGEKVFTEKPTTNPTGAGCKSDEMWVDCNLRCDQLCMYYEHVLEVRAKCSVGRKCVPGCWPQNQNMSCPPGFRWIDWGSCVRVDDCTCVSSSGTPVKPGEVIHESNCRVCICEMNHYTCDDSACASTSTIVPTSSTEVPITITEVLTTSTEAVSTTIIIIPSTVSPPPPCDPSRFIPLLGKLSDSTISASSVAEGSEPWHAKMLQGVVGTGWRPSTSRPGEYLQVDLGTAEPVYGLVTASTPHHVTSYHVLFSLDNITYSYILEHDKPQVFRGSVTGEPLQQIFVQPVEARYMRILPQTWVGGIALTLEMFGCGELTTTKEIVPTTVSETQPTTIAETLPTNVTETQPTTIAETLPTTVTKKQPTTIAETLPTTMTETQPTTITETLPTTVTKILPTTIAETLPTNVTVTQPTTIAETLPTTVTKTQPTTIAPTLPTTVTKTQSTTIAETLPTTVTETQPTTISEKLSTTVTKTQPTTIAETHPTTTTRPECTDEMGLTNGAMSPWQVSVSSSKHPHFNGSQAGLGDSLGWTPQLNSQSEFIQFDLLDERKLTGVKTAGVPHAWVTSYKFSYSHDGQTWNPVLTADHLEKVFLGNFDGSSVHTNYFDKPIHARYVRIYPNSWHNHVTLRLDILGCYQPYPYTITMEPPTSELPTTTEGRCNVCKGTSPVQGTCPCAQDLWWDGEQCTTSTLCPCYVGHIPYAVGTTYETEECDQCICSLNGIPRCSKKICPLCTEGLQAVLTPTCGCVCKPCMEGTRLCHTSNVCINVTSWCDGVTDCPDDEVNCVTTTTTQAPTTTQRSATTQTPSTTTKLPKLVCPPMQCPEGFDVVTTVKKLPQSEADDMNKPAWSPFGTKSKWSSLFKGGARKGVKGKGTKGLPPHKTVRPQPVQTVCPEYKCVPTIPEKETCYVPKCSENYSLKIVDVSDGKCPEYSCIQLPIPDGKCNVTSRTFDTFDGLEYKYDICDHILAEDLVLKQWQIRLKKICPYVGICTKALIVNQNNHILQFNEDLSVLYDDKHTYSVAQVEQIGSQSKEFAIRQVSDKFILFASALGFTIVWGRQGNVRIQVPGTSRGQVGGLCGFFDGQKDNDRRKPDGSLAYSNPDFGDSWGITGCEMKVCPLHIQTLAWEKCSVIKEEPLNQCNKLGSLDKAQSLCVESICDCLNKNVTDENACRCQALLDLVTQCQAVSPNVDLHAWRVLHDCPVECPAGLVYKECYSRMCEPNCDTLLQDNPCPVTNGECFPGCYCPDGLLRQGSQCARPATCRDCSCTGFGRSRFVTFDGVDFSFNGNCTHVLAKTLDTAVGPQFKILATNGPCTDRVDETCVKSLTLLFLDHVVFLGSAAGSTQGVSVDGVSVSLPHHQDWLTLDTNSNKDISLTLPELQLDLVFHGVDLGFSLKLPSHLYKGITEGLCGSCNGVNADDFKMVDGQITDNSDTFGKSWRVTDLPAVLGREDSCSVAAKNNTCTLPPQDSDLCLRLLDDALFSKCHAVVDPEPFVSLCHEDWCRENITGCQDLDPYVSECRAAGICLEWRSARLCPYQCPPGLEYKACGCDVTCDNVKLLKKEPGACNAPLAESCVCPDDLVWKNGTCIPETKCHPCDAEGHYAGDTWRPDSCTTCSCEEGNSVQCQRTECPNSGTVCEQGFRSIVEVGTENDCCPKYKCFKEQNKTCPPSKQPQCGYGQVMKTVTTPDACQDMICECLPSEDCPEITDLIYSEPGVESTIDTSGCCPQLKEVCKIEKCPPPPNCPDFWELRKRDVEQCCLQYKCEPPKETCLYEMKFIDDVNGGERERKTSERFVVAKKEGEKWQDGPCRQCECLSTGWAADCLVEKCPPLPSDIHFAIEAFPQPQQCCSQFKRIACRVGNSVFKEGEMIPSDDPCKNSTCLRSENGDLIIHDSVEQCSRNCPLGWEYIDPALGGQCCGQCKPIACVVGTKTYPPGESWSSDDNCIMYTCDDQMQVMSTHPTCSNIDDCPPENVYQDLCCPKCNFTTPESKKICAPEMVLANETVRLVRTLLPSHGLCENYETIHDFTECQGTCDSFTFYNKMSEHHDSQCQCCQPVAYATITVRLLCEDGFPTDKVVSVPSQCACEACEGNTPTLTNIIKGKPSRYTKA